MACGGGAVGAYGVSAGGGGGCPSRPAPICEAICSYRFRTTAHLDSEGEKWLDKDIKILQNSRPGPITPLPHTQNKNDKCIRSCRKRPRPPSQREAEAASGPETTDPSKKTDGKKGDVSISLTLLVLLMQVLKQQQKKWTNSRRRVWMLKLSLPAEHEANRTVM